MRTLPNGQISPSEYTETGYVDNLFSVGPAMLWTPFLLAAHCFVLLANALGTHIAANGFSTPYVLAMALGTAIYGFLGLLISYFLARKYVEERWAFLATVAIWGASSLPVYMYFNPAWSHAHSAFTVALLLRYWDRTRDFRTILQWNILGLLAGLMVDVYFPNGVFLLLPFVESRSEEHTSELQSHHDLVCRLLLEKKKIITTRNAHSARVVIQNKSAARIELQVFLDLAVSLVLN